MHAHMTYTIHAYTELTETSEIKAEIIVPAQDLASYRTKAIKKLSQAVKIDGFRKGKTPESVLIKHIGEHAILEESASMAIADIYPQVLKEKNVLIIDAPMVTISTLAEGSDFHFTLQAPVPPVFTLPDYSAVAKTTFGVVNTPEVTDEELKNALVSVRRQRKYIELLGEKMAPEKAATEVDKTPEAELPELDHDFLHTLGDYHSVEEFSTAVRANIIHEKTITERNKKRTAVMDALIEKTAIALPPVLIAHELDRLQAQFEADLQQIGSSLNAYLTNVKKTAEQFLEELKPQAVKQAKLQLILNAIAEKEHLIPEDATVHHEAHQLLEHYKDADSRAVHAYVTMRLRNEMVLEKLEALAIA